jgi:hypothetical protein
MDVSDANLKHILKQNKTFPLYIGTMHEWILSVR